MTSRKPPSQRDPAFATARMSRALQSMSPGSMGGRIANAAPVSIVTGVVSGGGGGGDDAPTGGEIIFSQSGALDESESATYMMRSSGTLVDMDVHMRVAGSTASTFLLMQNEATIHTLSVAAGVNHVVHTVNVAVLAGDLISVSSETAGEGASAVVVQVTFT